MTEKMSAFLLRTKENGWLCPQPQRWNDLWEILPDKTQQVGGWKPSLPLILAGWWASSGIEKRLRFEEHLRWADDHGAADSIIDYLETLSSEDWFNGHN
jgi:hypothetical protein